MFLSNQQDSIKLATSNLRGPGNVLHLARHHSGAQLPKVERKASQELPSCQAFITIFLLAHGSLSLTLFSCPSLHLGLALPCHHLCNPRWKHNGYWPCFSSPLLSSPTFYPHCLVTELQQPLSPSLCWFHTCLLSSHTSGSPARNPTSRVSALRPRLLTTTSFPSC